MTNNGPNPADLSGYAGLAGSGFSYGEGELKSSGDKFDEQAGKLGTLKGNSNELHVGFPHFGVVAWGLHSAHNNAIQSRESALQRAEAALKSWKDGLAAADANYKDADKLPQIPPTLPIDTPSMPKVPGAGDLPNMKTPEVPNTGLPDAGDLGLPKPPGTDLPGSDRPDTDLPGTDLPGTDLPGTDLPGSDLPGSDVPGADVPGVNTPKVPDASLPNVPTTDPADMKVPSIDAALNDPSKTDLSQYQPTTPSLNTNLPTTDPSVLNPRPSTPSTPSTVGGPVVGTGTGVGVPNAGLPNANAAGLRSTMGAGGMPMPMMPMGAGAGGDQERDREKTVGLSEDEGVWMGDEDIAPQVIGQEEI